jgi:dynein heavy chain, axonemal
MFDSF